MGWGGRLKSQTTTQDGVGQKWRTSLVPLKGHDDERRIKGESQEETKTQKGERERGKKKRGGEDDDDDEIVISE